MAVPWQLWHTFSLLVCDQIFHHKIFASVQKVWLCAMAGLLSPAALQFAVPSPACSDDSLLAAGSAAAPAADAAAGTAAAPAADSLITLTNAAPDDPVVTVLFYFAVTVLSVVTLGVRC